MVESPAATVKAPIDFGAFELLQVIGRGANATVYKARHKATGRIAAVKILPRLLGMDPGAIERFRREFTVIRQLQHRHLVRSLAHGVERGLHYVVVEFVPGLNLEQLLKKRGALSIEHTAVIFVQLADALRHLHARHILHRDIKPSNIFLTTESIAKLGDFGLLKQLSEDTQITQTNQSLGTIEYGAPEQFEDAKRVDRRCDIFSLAATMYTTLTGKFPFGNAGQMQTLQRKLLCQFVPLRILLLDLDPAIDQLVNRCLDPDPRRRPSDCDEFLEVLGSTFADPTLSTLTASDTITNGTPFDPSATDGPGAGKPVPKEERRASIRYNVDLTATFVPFHENTRGRWNASILDISSLGVRLQTSCEVAVGSVVHLTLGNLTTPELALVRWVRTEGTGTFTIGCTFVRPLSRKDLEQVCQSAPK